VLDVALRHHEYLDGTGYPDNLSAHQISDLARLMTICDIFGALLERRPYKAPLSVEEAYHTLVSMGPKLDSDMVRELRRLTRA
jgi:HD-GYP domain-containing protein (c-di-GMP phosphodiesterase class II)